MRTIIFLLLIQLTIKAQNVPQWEWDASFTWIINGWGGPYIKIDKDKENNFYVVENFGNLKKYNSSKTLLWAFNFNGIVNTLTASEYGDIFVSGIFNGTLQAGYMTLVAKGANDIFLAKLNRYGNIMWLKQIGSAGYDGNGAMCLDENNLFITGYTADSTHFGNFLFPKSNANDLFIAKYDLGGNFIDVKFATLLDPPAANDGSAGSEIKIGPDKNLYLIAWFHKNVKFDDTLFSGSYNNYLLKLNKDFKLLKRKGIGSYYMGSQFDLNIDSKGNVVYLYKYFANHDGPSGGILKLSPDWTTYIWTEPIHWNNAINTIDLDETDNVYYSGWTNRRDSGPDPPIAMNYMYTGMRYSNGQNAWQRFDSAKYIEPQNIIAMNNNEVMVAGSFGDTLKLKSEMFPPSNCFVASIKNTITVNTSFKTLDGVKITLYPNPSPGKFSISGIPLDSKICIYDISGRCVYTRANLADEEIDLSGKEKGIYFLEAIAENGMLRKKLVIE